MPRAGVLSARCLPLATLLLALACGHDSPRDSPVDPKLTPPVELEVALDDAAGTATLTWTRYEGDQPFAAYWVLRNEPQSTRVETLTALTDARQIVYVDSLLAPGSPYVYRVSTVNGAGFEAASRAHTARALHLAPVEILDANPDSRTASCSLAWTPYGGPRFRAYEVWRAHGTSSELRHTALNQTATAFVDTSLLGNTEYQYTVRTVTEEGAATTSAPATARVHGLETIWPLDLAAEERVRLSHDGEGRISAATAHVEANPFPESTRAVLYRLGRSTGPDIVDELLYACWWDRGPAPPAVMATEIVDDNTRWTALSGYLFDEWRLELFSSARDSVLRRQPLTRQPTLMVPDEYAEVATVVTLWSSWTPMSIYSISAYDDGEEICVHDFSQGEPPGLVSWRVRVGNNYVPAEEGVEFSGDALVLGEYTAAIITLDVPEHRSDSFRIEVEMAGPGAVWIGGNAEAPPDFAHCILIAQTYSGKVHAGLYSTSSLTAAGSLESDIVPNHVNPEGRYTIALGLDSGTVEATVPGDILDVVWSATDTPQEPLSAWTSLAAVESGFALLTIADRLYSVSPNGDVRKAFIAPLGGDVAELCVWEDPAEAGMYHVGMCVPDLHSIHVDRARAPSSRSRSVTVMSNQRWSLSEAAGPDPGSFLFPLSFAIGPNGRIYVLDAGNSRIQVFSAHGDYITQWGRRGSGPGEFDFGQGMAPEDFRGSIAVDDGGYIFVADPGNQRIQVFSP